MDEKKVREAIELIKQEIYVLEEFVNYGGIIEEKKKKHIGLYNTAIEALKKQLPKKGMDITMNVLEKILKEIEEMRDIMKSTVTTNCFGKECENEDCTVCVCERAMEVIRSHMNHNSGDTEMDDWILCSERLPEDGTYLCTLDGELVGEREPFTGMCGIENGKWDEEGCVIAWKPLPEPYKGE